MAAFLNDTFADSDGDELSLAHTPDVGAAWFKAAGGGGNHLVISANRAVRNNAAASVWVRYVSTQAPPAADYFAEAVVRPLTVAQYAALAVRASSDYTSAYEVWFTNTGVLLVRLVGSAPTTLVTQAYTWTAGTDYTVRLDVSGTGAAVDLVLKVDGSIVATFSDTNAARITATGSVGIAAFDGSASAGFVFDSVVGDAAAVDSLSITKPVAWQTFQRSGTTASIPVAGTNAGATENIESNFNGAGYGIVATAVPAGAFTGSRAAQTAGRGSFVSRKAITTTSTQTVPNVGIGDVFAVGGDSNFEGRLTSAQSYSGGQGAAMFRQDDGWAALADPADTGTSGGSIWPLVGNQHSADQAVPVAFITAATGGTDAAGSATTWASGGADYNNLIQQVTDSGTNALKGILMSLGPNAVVSASTPSQASIEAALTAMANGFAGAIAGAPKTMVALFGEVNTGSPPDRRTAIDNYRKAILSRWALGGNIVVGPNFVDLNFSDDVHLKTDAEGLLAAKRLWACMDDAWFGGANGRGPRLSAATWNGARNQITIVFDRALKTGITFGSSAWIVSDNGTPLTISGIAYHGSNPAAIVISTSAAATGAAGTTTLTFASGNDAAGVAVPCTTDITPPTGAAFQIPAEPIYAAAVGENDTTAPILTSPSGAGGTLTCSGSVGTDEAGGTLYAVVTASASAPSAAQVKAGQDHTGAGALRVVSQAVAATGSQTIVSGSCTAGTRYWHFMQEDAATNQSTVASSASFTVTGAATATIATEPFKTWGGVVQASHALGRVVILHATSGALVLNLTGQSTDGAGVLTISHASLTAAVDYMVAAWDAGGSPRGIKKYTAA